MTREADEETKALKTKEILYGNGQGLRFHHGLRRARFALAYSDSCIQYADLIGARSLSAKTSPGGH
jgi:hypothetical protein